MNNLAMMPTYGITSVNKAMKMPEPALFSIIRAINQFRKNCGQAVDRIDISWEMAEQFTKETGCNLPMKLNGCVISTAIPVAASFAHIFKDLAND